MNRKKKINETLKKKLKKKNAKLHKSNKPRYISKAERAKLEQEQEVSQAQTQVEGQVNEEIPSDLDS
jgi:Zn-dependent M16 (insulinase) family peptidase